MAKWGNIANILYSEFLSLILIQTRLALGTEMVDPGDYALQGAKSSCPKGDQFRLVSKFSIFCWKKTVVITIYSVFQIQFVVKKAVVITIYSGCGGSEHRMQTMGTQYS